MISDSGNSYSQLWSCSEEFIYGFTQRNKNNFSQLKIKCKKTKGHCGRESVTQRSDCVWITELRVDFFFPFLGSFFVYCWTLAGSPCCYLELVESRRCAADRRLHGFILSCHNYTGSNGLQGAAVGSQQPQWVQTLFMSTKLTPHNRVSCFKRHKERLIRTRISKPTTEQHDRSITHLKTVLKCSENQQIQHFFKLVIRHKA